MTRPRDNFKNKHNFQNSRLCRRLQSENQRNRIERQLCRLCTTTITKQKTMKHEDNSDTSCNCYT